MSNLTLSVAPLTGTRFWHIDRCTPAGDEEERFRSMRVVDSPREMLRATVLGDEPIERPT